jgi:ubiquinone/menaquinone biosynthesis C-methylase UbiE
MIFCERPAIVWSMKTLLAASLAAVLLAPAAFPQVAKKANEGYQTPEDRAKVAKTLDDPHRTEQMKPRQIVAALDVKPGSTVADIGTGVGFMLPYLEEAVGPGGRIYAEDIRQDFLDKAEARARSGKWSNVTFVLGDDRDPHLPEGQLDLAFTLEVYHHFDYPAEMLAHISRALKPDGRLVIADFYKNRRGGQGKDMSGHIRIDKNDVIQEVESNGYRLLSARDHSDNMYILIFAKQ